MVRGLTQAWRPSSLHCVHLSVNACWQQQAGELERRGHPFLPEHATQCWSSVQHATIVCSDCDLAAPLDMHHFCMYSTYVRGVMKWLWLSQACFQQRCHSYKCHCQWMTAVGFHGLWKGLKPPAGHALPCPL
jgi:hypothetical protein